MLKDFKHEHVLGLIGVAIEKNHPYVLLPYMENGDLKSFISNEENVSDQEIDCKRTYTV